MPTTDPPTVRRPPRNVNADPRARQLAPISAADAESERDRLAFDDTPEPSLAEQFAVAPWRTLAEDAEHERAQREWYS